MSVLLVYIRDQEKGDIWIPTILLTNLDIFFNITKILMLGCFMLQYPKSVRILFRKKKIFQENAEFGNFLNGDV